MNYLAEYFAVIGATEKETNNGRRGSNPVLAECEGILLDRFPEEDYPDLPLPPHIWMFCFPDGIKFHTSPQNPTFSANVLTQGDGTRMYIASLIFYEPVTPTSLKDGIKNLGRDFGQKIRSLSVSRDSSPSSSPTSFFLNSAPLYAPKCLCLISKFPLFSLLKDFLSHIYLLLMSPSNIPLERYIANVINEACFPTAGNVKLQITIGNEKIGTTIPSVKDLEIADFSFHYLFEVLDVENILIIIECILNEKKILFTTNSTNSVLITFVIESIFSLLYPFGWPYVYVPVIPISLLTFLEAPTPFILGVCKAQDLLTEEHSDVVKVDLDKNRLFCVPDNLPKLPNRHKLYHDVRAMVHPDLYNTGAILGSRRKGATDEDYLNVRRVFLDYFASLFTEWRSYILVMDDKVNEPTPIFNKASFLKAVPKEHMSFLEAFVQTYVFDSFIQEYQNVVSLNLFEETISRLKNVRERGRSVSEKPSQAVTVVTRPNTEGLSSDIVYTYNSQFPRLSQKQFVPKVRPANKGLPHIKRRLGQGFDYHILFKAARASLPDDSEVSMFFLYYIVDKIFRSSTLDSVELTQLNDLLKEAHGRHQFAHLLQEHREKRSSNALQPAAFKLLASMMDTSLLEAEKADDFETCKIIMNLGSSFCLKQDNGSMEFIRSRLKKREVWFNIEFWSYVLRDDIKQYHLNKNVAESEDIFSTPTKEKQQIDLANTIFGLIVNIAYSMVNMAIPGNVIMYFVHKMCEEYNLSDEHAQTLKKMIDKMCNFCVDSPQPDRVIKSAFTPSSDPQPIFRSREGGGSTGGLRNKVVRRLIERSNSAPDLSLTPTSSSASLPGLIEE